MPKGCEEGVLKGLYRLKKAAGKRKLRVQLMGSGTILREVEAAADILANNFNADVDVLSATSFNELRRDGLDVSRRNLLNPGKKAEQPWITQVLSEVDAPVVAATDHIKLYADQVREWVPGVYKVLGTDGFGRSDSRTKLREHFEVNRHYIVVAALNALAEKGDIKPAVVTKAIKDFGIDINKLNPLFA